MTAVKPEPIEDVNALLNDIRGRCSSDESENVDFGLSNPLASVIAD